MKPPQFYVHFNSTYMLLRNYTPYLVGIIMLMSLLVPTACIQKNFNKPVITVSIQPQKYLLEQIAGNKWEIKCLLTNGANPESYDPSLSHLLNLENSKAYFRIGNIPFESAIINKVQNNRPGLKIYDNSEGIELITGTHSHGDKAHADEPDPHTWTSVKNAKKIALNMYKALADLDPSQKDFYKANLQDLTQRLDSMDNAIARRLSDKDGHAFVVWHPSLSYFARDYGLTQISLSPEGKEASIGMLQSAIDDAKAHNATVMFFQKDIDSRQAQVANEQIGAEFVSINPLSYSWDKEIETITDALAK